MPTLLGLAGLAHEVNESEMISKRLRRTFDSRGIVDMQKLLGYFRIYL
jgi:hypothetical protein